MILTLAGAIGVVFVLLRWLTTSGAATIGRSDSLPILAEWPLAIMAPAVVVALVMGVLGVRHHSALFVYIGAAAGIASLSALGLVPLLAVASIGFMIRAHVEGEDTTLATPTPSPDDWPDKAMAASMLLFVTGLITLFQSGLAYADRADVALWDDAPWIWATWSLVVGLACLVAAWQIYHLRTPWLGAAAAILGVLAFGFYLVGPILAVVALVLLGLAGREQEFTVHAA